MLDGFGWERAGKECGRGENARRRDGLIFVELVDGSPRCVGMRTIPTLSKGGDTIGMMSPNSHDDVPEWHSLKGRTRTDTENIGCIPARSVGTRRKLSLQSRRKSPLKLSLNFAQVSHIVRYTCQYSFDGPAVLTRGTRSVGPVLSGLSRIDPPHNLIQLAGTHFLQQVKK